MKGKRSFDIAFVGLKPGEHSFEYKIDDHFFEEYQPQDFTNCQATVKLTLDKSNSLIMLRFEIGGSAEAICDRCGNNRPFQLWDEFKMLVKMVDNPDEMNETEEDPDVYYIGRTESHIHTADWIFEFINLSLPTQRMCNAEEIGGPFCNKEVLQKLAEMKPQVASANIWKGLNKFKDIPDDQN
jgi:uncharacterized metal-binding protein YceD (DUF177 family)